MKKLSLPDQMNGYLVIPIALNQDKKSPVYHILYIKKHEAKNTLKDSPEVDNSGRIIYAVNLPISTTISNIKELFQDIAGVIVEDFRPEIGNRGQIILVDKASCTRLLSKAKQLYKLETDPICWHDDNTKPFGYQKYITYGENQFPQHEILMKEVNNFMAVYNDAEEREKQTRRSRVGLVDEDGFTLVVNHTKGSKGSIAAQENATQQKLKDEMNKRNKKKQMSDFYRFQIREQKKKATNDILKNYNDDKAKILELREKRRFKPY